MSKWINEQMAPPNSVGMRFTTVYDFFPDVRANMMYGLLRDKKQLMSQIIREIGFMFMMYALRFDISSSTVTE